MTDFLVQLALSNLLISAILASIALAVHRRGHYPGLAHLLWVLVLVKVVTPPLLQLPIVPGLGAAASAIGRSPTGVATGETLGGVAHLVPVLADYGSTLLLGIWTLGSLIILTASLVRIVGFDRLLRRSSCLAPRHVQTMAAGVAWQLGLQTPPTIHTSRARLSPMTWWVGGTVRVVLPAALLDQIDAAQLRWVLAHELAHVKRRDHLVRWLEWLACVSFWWNPIVWFARRNLRLAEEVSCDALVLERLQGQPRAYAKALLTVVEFLAGHARRPPAVASGIDTGGTLERRFMAIVSDGRLARAPRSLVAGAFGSAIVLMSVGLGFAADVEPTSGTTDRSGATLAASRERLDSGTKFFTGNHVTDQTSGETFALLGAEVNVAATLGGSREGAGAPGERPQGIVFVGTPDDDVVAGTRARDRIAGKAGADQLTGRGGRDVILGGAGADTISGGAGPDRLSGGPGDDTIDGGRGRDAIQAGSGADTVRSGAGNDVVRTWQDGLPDAVDCGAGDADRAIIDSSDTTVDCEVVLIREAA